MAAASVVRQAPSVLGTVNFGVPADYQPEYGDNSVAQTRAWISQLVNDYSDSVRRAHMCFQQQQQSVINSFLPPSLIEQALDPEATSTTRITGRERLALLRKGLDSLGLTFSDDQREFMNRMIAACAKLIFKDDLDSNIDDLLAELNIAELHQELMAIMPRRFGKTFSVAAFVVALLFAIEGLEIGIFSTGRRASQKILELVYWFMCKVPGMRERIIKHNVETIWLQGPAGPDDIRKVSSYPSNVRISLFALSFLFCFRAAKRVRAHAHTHTHPQSKSALCFFLCWSNQSIGRSVARIA